MSSRLMVPLHIEVAPDRSQFVAGTAVWDREHLRVHIAGDVLTARWPAHDTFDDPPMCRARLQRRPDGGVTVDGEVHESFAARMWARIWVVPMLVMAAVAVGGVVAAVNGAHKAVWLAVFGAVAAALFALMWRWQQRLRGPSFDRDARRLTEGLTRYLTTGDSSRALLR